MAVAIQMRHRITGLKLQFAAHEAPIGAGVVHGVIDTTRLTRSSFSAKYARVALTIGTSTNGRKNSGFLMIGAPEQNRFVDVKYARHDPHPADRPQMYGLAAQQHQRQRQVEPTPPISR